MTTWTSIYHIGDEDGMASTAIGKLDDFDPSYDSITAYAERANLYFQANGIEEGTQVAVFLSAIGVLFIKKIDNPNAVKGQILSQDSGGPEKALRTQAIGHRRAIKLSQKSTAIG